MLPHTREPSLGGPRAAPRFRACAYAARNNPNRTPPRPRARTRREAIDLISLITVVVEDLPQLAFVVYVSEVGDQGWDNFAVT